MVANVVNVVFDRLAVLKALHYAADVGLSLGSGTKGSGIGKNRFKKLERNYFPALVHNWLYGSHAYVFKTLKMCKIALSESHKEAYALDTFYIKSKGFKLLVVEQVHIFFAYLGEIIHAFYLHRLSFYPFAVLDIAALCGHLADIYFGIEVGGKGIAVVSSIAVKNVDIVYLVEVMLLSIGAEHPGNARVETAAEQCGESCLFKFFAVRPLPFVLKLCGVLRLIVCGIHIVYSAFKAGVHYCKVLIGQSHVYAYFGLIVPHKSGKLAYTVGVYFCG